MCRLRRPGHRLRSGRGRRLDELLHPRLPHRAGAHDGCVRCNERRQPVERSLRSYLLHRPDPGVGDEDPEEERVLPLAERQRQATGDGQDQIEDGEDVRADDPGVRATALRPLRWPALGQAAFRLGLREPLLSRQVVRERDCHNPAGPIRGTLPAGDRRSIAETPDQLGACPQSWRARRGTAAVQVRETPDASRFGCGQSWGTATRRTSSMALRKESSRQAGRAAHRRAAGARTRHRRRADLLTRAAALAVALAILPAAPAPAAPGHDTAEPGQRTAVAVFLVRGERVIPVRRFVPHTVAVARAAVSSLLRGPTAAERKSGCSSLIPAGTGLRGVSVSRGVAAVDLSRRFESGGGSLSMQLRVAQVVFTLTQFPAVSRVAFRLDGRPVESIGGEGILVSPPVGRAGFEAQTPPILVEQPLPGDLVGRSILVRGTANVFEARLVVDLVTTNGVLLARRNILATAGTGTRGRFSVRMSLAAPVARFVHRCLCAPTEERRPDRPRAHSRNGHAGDLTGRAERAGSSSKSYWRSLISALMLAHTWSTEDNERYFCHICQSVN